MQLYCKIKKTLCVLALLLLVGLFTACSEDIGTIYDATDDESISGSYAYPNPVWQTITPTDARLIMEESDSFILLDVRTASEFQNIRIYGAVLIPYNEITSRAAAELKEKNTVVLVYCQAGRRSALAAASLAALGFTAVYDIGGIIDWPYETIRG